MQIGKHWNRETSCDWQVCIEAWKAHDMKYLCIAT